jgi:hypothetical protein
MVRISVTAKVMKSLLKYLAWLLLFLFLAGCEKLDRQADEARGFFRPPPVLPVLDLIQTSVPAGFCSVVAMSDQQGYAIPGAEISHADGLSLIHLENHRTYPLSLLAVPCDEIYILRLGMDEEMCFISAFFVSEMSPGRLQAYHVGPFPVMLDDHLVRAILVRNQVTVEDELDLELNISLGEIDMAMERLNAPKPEDVSVAVEQDAWIIEITPEDTWTDFSDDKFMITGGEQNISTLTDMDGNAASILQMATIGLVIGPECLRNPVSGFTVLREIGIDTDSSKQLDDLMLGTILYTFNKSCTGRVRVALATGSFLLSLGREIDFNMMDH